MEKLTDEFSFDSSNISDDEDPSPDILGQSQFSTISSDPSPVSLSITELLKTREVESFEQDDLACLLNQVIPKLTNLNGVKSENIVSLTSLIGSHFSTEVKAEAYRHRLVRAREDESFSVEEILDKEHKIEGLHVFFESITRKSGRKAGPHREKVASLQATFYEAVLKGSNLRTVGPASLMTTNEMLNKVHSKHALKGNIGGSYSFHQKTSTIIEPFPIALRGPVVSDNAQKEWDRSTY